MTPKDRACTAALAALPRVGPNRLEVLLGTGDPAAVWHRVRTGTLAEIPEVVEALGSGAATLTELWRDHARQVDPDALARAHRALGLRLVLRGDPDYPEAFARDPEPPRLVWVAGDLDRLGERRVAIVGTRRCTRYGHDVARRFGAELGCAGVSVVSGLALGVDAAAHRGALEAPDGAGAPVGVVGTGLDVVYPRRNRELWHQVAERGVLLSEAPPGARAEPWRFPARNRLIAALAEIVVVVESAERGGSLYTVDEAVVRDVEVRAVPGPITSTASAGTNRLLADGAAPALSPGELLETLGLPVAGSAAGSGPSEAFRDPEERRVLDVLTTGPVTLDDLAERSGLSLERLGLVIARLQVEQLVVRSGGWYEATG